MSPGSVHNADNTHVTRVSRVSYVLPVVDQNNRCARDDEYNKHGEANNNPFDGAVGFSRNEIPRSRAKTQKRFCSPPTPDRFPRRISLVREPIGTRWNRDTTVRKKRSAMSENGYFPFWFLSCFLPSFIPSRSASITRRRFPGRLYRRFRGRDRAAALRLAYLST